MGCLVREGQHGERDERPDPQQRDGVRRQGSGLGHTDRQRRLQLDCRRAGPAAGCWTRAARTHFGACAASDLAEANCSLNKNTANDAEDPRVAAGTMVAGNPTVPVGHLGRDVQRRQAGVRLAAGRRRNSHFEVANNGAADLDSERTTRRAPTSRSPATRRTCPWREDIEGGVTKGFIGHFVNAANPTFKLDESDVPLTPTGAGAGQADVRTPISIELHRGPVQRRRLVVHRQRRRHAVLPVHQRDEPAQPVRGCLPAGHPGDGRREQHHDELGNGQRERDDERRRRERLVPVRHDRPAYGGTATPTAQKTAPDGQPRGVLSRR